MATSLKRWLQTSVKKLKKIDNVTYGEQTFFRDPTRPVIYNRNYFYSPADGIILYQKVINPHEAIEIKGRELNLDELLDPLDMPTVPCLVISVFMTQFDVHVNRIPLAGVLKFRKLDPILSYNTPMLFVENDLLKQHFDSVFSHLQYQRYNARMVNSVYSPQMAYKYHLVQIADEEINVITHFTTKQNQWFDQAERFSFIRWGSQVALVLPLDQRFKFKALLPDTAHVQGGIDRLVKIS